MKKILIIPDVHGRKFWREAIESNESNVDRVIFLGDYLDPYPYEIRDSPDSMECKSFDDCDSLIKMLNDIVSLKKSNPEKYILLTGNHTDSYIWKDFSSATRTDHINWKDYHNFYLENLNLFNFVWIENDVIFSHAGISEGWANNFLDTYMKYDDSALSGISYVKECAEVLRDTSLKDFNKYYIEAISEISFYRYGDAQYGSCEWADMREHCDKINGAGNITPAGPDDVYQVFGHTQLKREIITNKWACLDCRKSFIIDAETHEIS